MPVPRQYQPIIFNSVAYQAAANTQYQNKVAVAPRQFSSDYERMLYLHGRQNQASCGVPAPAPTSRQRDYK